MDVSGCGLTRGGKCMWGVEAIQKALKHNTSKFLFMPSIADHETYICVYVYMYVCVCKRYFVDFH